MSQIWSTCLAKISSAFWDKRLTSVQSKKILFSLLSLFLEHIFENIFLFFPLSPTATCLLGGVHW